jgi:hypothetical protein
MVKETWFACKTNRMNIIDFIIHQPSEDGRVILEKEVPGKTVKIVFTPTTDGTVKVDTVEVKYCAEPGIAIY